LLANGAATDAVATAVKKHRDESGRGVTRDSGSLVGGTISPIRQGAYDAGVRLVYPARGSESRYSTRVVTHLFDSTRALGYDVRDMAHSGTGRPEEDGPSKGVAR